MENKIKAVLFDMDGTLVDSEPLHFAAHKEALNHFGIEISKEEYILYGTSSSSKKFYAKISEMKGIEIDIAEAQKFKKELYAKTKSQMKIMEGVIEVLESLKEKYLLAVVSSSNSENIKNTLTHAGIEKYFQVTIGGDEVKNGKPAPDGYLRVAELLGVNPDECVVVEDSINGVTAGKSAGMKTIAIPNEYTKIQDFSLADEICTNIKDLKGKI